MASDIHIPGYEIKYLLGRGGMAAVYLAIQESFGREVALKILAPDHHADEEFSKRFLREASIVSRLVHPNIVTVYDVGIHEGYHYLSMEFIPGQDLKEAHPSLSKSDVVRIIKDVAQALEYASNKGYVHRDIKPENIMLHEDGRVILTDFGIARGHDTTTGVTQTGKAIGTPHYMSPEQTKGLKVDRRSDIYSLGVVLYQMLTGFVPYDAPSAVAVGIKHITAAIPRLPQGQEILQPIINTCLSKNPDHRFQTAAELIEALDAISEEKLAAMDARAAAFRQLGQDDQSETMLDSAISDEVIAAVSSPQKKAATPSPKKAITNPPLNTPSQPKRRRLLLFLLLLSVIVWAGFQKQDRLVPLWHHWQQKLLARLAPPPAAPPPTAAEETTLPENTGLATLDASPAETTPSVSEPAPPPALPSMAEEHPAAIPPAEPPATDRSTRPAEAPYLPGRQNTRPLIVKPGERLRQLRAGLDDQPQNALEMIAIYRQMLKKQPRNPVARKGLRELREWYAQQIQIAFNNKDIPRTRQLVEMMKRAFPRVSNNPKLIALEQKLVRAELLQTHLQKAQDYLEADALTEPAGANALEELRAALLLDPENTEAQQGIQDIADTFLKKAKQLKRAGKFTKAMSAVEAGLQAMDDNAPLLALRGELKTAIQQQKRIDALLSQADKQLRAGNLVEPQGSSAYDRYRRILAKQPNNRRAKKGLKKIERRLLKQANTAIQAAQLEQAETILATAERYFGNSQSIGKAREQLAQAIDAIRPKITKIVFSGRKLVSIDIPQANKLQLGRTLFVGFEYKNFEADSTLLQAFLMDGTGRIQIAQKPVIVNGASGKHLFDIELPVDGFADGSYQLELKLAGKPVITASFLVDNLSQP